MKNAQAGGTAGDDGGAIYAEGGEVDDGEGLGRCENGGRVKVAAQGIVVTQSQRSRAAGACKKTEENLQAHE